MGNNELKNKAVSTPEDLTKMLMGSSFCEESEREYLECFQKYKELGGQWSKPAVRHFRKNCFNLQNKYRACLIGINEDRLVKRRSLTPTEITKRRYEAAQKLQSQEKKQFEEEKPKSETIEKIKLS